LAVFTMLKEFLNESGKRVSYITRKSYRYD
jgi:hypothetical protein